MSQPPDSELPRPGPEPELDPPGAEAGTSEQPPADGIGTIPIELTEYKPRQIAEAQQQTAAVERELHNVQEGLAFLDMALICGVLLGSFGVVFFGSLAADQQVTIVTTMLTTVAGITGTVLGFYFV